MKRAQGENQLRALRIHRDAVGRVTQKPTRIVGEKFDPWGTGIGHKNAGVLLYTFFFKNQQIVGQNAISSLKKAGCQRGLAEAAFPRNATASPFTTTVVA